jgi:pimeloyl-ACP methyl ester carboxylesterase
VLGGQQLTWLFSAGFLRNHVDALDRLDGIKAPTLVIVGEQDLLTPPWVAREVALGIPGARFATITGDGSSHVVPLERPDEFNRLVTNFLAGSAPRPTA